MLAAGSGSIPELSSRALFDGKKMRGNGSGSGGSLSWAAIARQALLTGAVFLLAEGKAVVAPQRTSYSALWQSTKVGLQALHYRLCPASSPHSRPMLLRVLGPL